MTAISAGNIKKNIFRGVSIAPLVAFRIIFGLLMLFGVLRFVSKGWVDELYIQPKFHFTYLGFEWVKPLPDFWMYTPFLLMVAACVGIVFGAFYRFHSILFFLCFTYVELLDKSYYLNHYYFVSLIAFWMILVPANADFSWDAKRKPEIRRTRVPAWCIGVIQLQLAIVYFFAGIAKLNTDWLYHAQPLKTWLQAYRDLPVVGGLFASAWLAFAFSWVGCLYDLCIPFLLWSKKFRTPAYVFVVIFHVLTWMLFPIGVFPWVMIFSTLIFFPAALHKKWLRPVMKWFGWQQTVAVIHKIKVNKAQLTFFSLFFAIQLALPFRYLAYPGELFWHEQGFRFSWRVMLMHKEAYATFYVHNKKTGGEMEIDNAQYLSPTQADQMATQPDMILAYAAYLKQQFADTILQYRDLKIHITDPEIRASIYVSLNGRPSQLFVAKDKDLTQYKINYKPITWLEPFSNTQP